MNRQRFKSPELLKDLNEYGVLTHKYELIPQHEQKYKHTYYISIIKGIIDRA